MREGLRKIAQRFALRACLFCVESEMIGITEHSFEHNPGLVEFFRTSLTRACQRLHKPEGTHVECALLTRKSVNAGLRRITVDQAIANETTLTWVLEDSG